jgi:hypothetical protein
MLTPPARRAGALALLMLGIAACSPAPRWTQLGAGRGGEETIAGAPLRLPRAPMPPKIDGVLDDDAWATAATLGPFVDPGAGAVVSSKHPVAAGARMTWDDRFLYLGVVVHDRSPTSPFARGDVDPHVWGAASGVELMLQPGDPGDNRDYYELQVDVNGAVFDSHFDDYNAPVTGSGADRRYGHQEWSSQVERAIFKKAGDLWVAEIALPWASLQPARTAVPPHPGEVWRLNLYSFRDGQRRALAWSPLRGRGNFHKSERFGRVQFAD